MARILKLPLWLKIALAVFVVLAIFFLVVGLIALIKDYSYLNALKYVFGLKIQKPTSTPNNVANIANIIALK